MLIRAFKVSHIFKELVSLENLCRLSTWIGLFILVTVTMDILGIINTRVLLDIVAIILGIYFIVLGIPEIIKKSHYAIKVVKDSSVNSNSKSNNDVQSP